MKLFKVLGLQNAPKSLEKLPSSDVQKLRKVEHQPYPYRAPIEIPKLPLQEPTWAV